MAFLNCALPFPGQGQFVGLASNVSINGPDRTWPRWPAFFDSELCNMDCGDEFGMEFNCGGIGAAGILSVIFVFASSGYLSRTFLREGNQKHTTCLKGFRSS